MRWDRRGDIATITLDRQAKRNAMTLEMWRDLSAVAAAVGTEGGVRVVIVRGSADGDFSAGADVAEFGTVRQGEVAASEYSRVVEEALAAIAALPVPSIALVEGYCVGGGCELAVACDLRVASANARFGVTPAKLGIVLSLPSVQRLAAAVGPAAATYLLLTANIVPADRALAMGLVHEVHDPEQFEAAGEQIAEQVASLAAVTHRGTRAIVARLMRGQVSPDDDVAELYRTSYRSAEYQEGVRAFLGRRTPDFRSTESIASAE